MDGRISIEKCREELGNVAGEMTDEQVKEVRNSLYAMAELALDTYFERCKMKAMEKDIPQIIKDVGFDFSWDEKKVWALDYPPEEMDIEELTWHFDIPFHWHGGEVYNLKSREVIDNPEKYKDEYERTMKADISHPIDIMENKGRWLILDGLHRLMKLYIQGNKTVMVRKIPRERIPDITAKE